MTQGIQKQIGVLPAIETEGHCAPIGRKMLRANLVPCAHDAALQKRGEHALRYSCERRRASICSFPLAREA
jgi:hypothetical protein